MTRRALAFTLRTLVTLGGIGALSAGQLLAQEGNVPSGIPHLDHVFVIMMENHAYDQIVGNPSSPFTNKLHEVGEHLHELLSRSPIRA